MWVNIHVHCTCTVHVHCILTHCTCTECTSLHCTVHVHVTKVPESWGFLFIVFSSSTSSLISMNNVTMCFHEWIGTWNVTTYLWHVVVYSNHLVADCSKQTTQELCDWDDFETTMIFVRNVHEHVHVHTCTTVHYMAYCTVLCTCTVYVYVYSINFNLYYCNKLFKKNVHVHNVCCSIWMDLKKIAPPTLHNNVNWCNQSINV